MKNKDFINRIKDYRERSETSRAVEERSLIKAMHEMNELVGKGWAFKKTGSLQLPVEIFDDCDHENIQDFDGGLNGIYIAIYRDDEKISRISSIIRNDKYEEELILSIMPRSVAGNRQWHEEIYRRSRQEGIEIGTKSNLFPSAEKAIIAYRATITNAAIETLSYNQMFLKETLPLDDIEASKKIEGLISQALDMKSKIENNRRVQENERFQTIRALNGIWNTAQNDISFLTEIGFDLYASEKELSVTASSTNSSLEIKTVHSFGYETFIILEIMDNDPKSVLVSLKDSLGRHEAIAEYNIKDGTQLKEIIVANILNEIESNEKVWVPDDELDYNETPKMN